jgi:hypothetical protein
MVKLIRLTGDASAPGNNSNTEIQNTFRDNIFVEPNSRVALRSCFLEINAKSTDRKFPVKTTSDNYQYKIPNVTASPDSITVQPTVDDYTDLSLLLRELQFQANKTLPSTSGTFSRDVYQGIHNVWRKVGNRAQLDVYQSIINTADYLNDFIITEGNQSTLDLAQGALGVIGATGANEVVLQNIFNTPVLAHETVFEATEITDGAGNFAEFEWSMVVNDDPSQKLWTVKLTDVGTYKLFVNGSQVGETSSNVASDGDIISVKKEGTLVTLVVTFAVAPGSPETKTGTLSDTFASFQNISNELKIINTGGVTPLILGSLSSSGGQPCEVMQIESLEPTSSQLSQTSPVRIEVQFNGTLGSILGYTTSGKLDNAGNPASFTSNLEPPGQLSDPGIMVCIDGLDLESYSGRQVGSTLSAQGSLNILDVIYPTHERPSEIQYFADFPVPLFLKNTRQLNIKDLNVRFVRNNSGKPLVFRGNPTVVLEIYSPGEST